MDIRVEPAGRDTMRVIVSGDLDLASRPRFVAAVAETASSAPSMIEVDLTAASFLDAAGVGALVDARNAVAAEGRLMRVRGAAGVVFQVLEICGVVDFLNAQIDSGRGGDE